MRKCEKAKLIKATILIINNNNTYIYLYILITYIKFDTKNALVAFASLWRFPAGTGRQYNVRLTLDPNVGETLFFG